MGRILRKKFAIYILLIIVIFLIGVTTVTYSIIRDKEFKLENETEIIHKTNYKMQINYPVFNNKKVNKEINNIILKEKENFLEEVNNNKTKDNELNLNYNYSTKDKIYSVHMRTYSYTGDNKSYYRNDIIIYLDSDTNLEIDIKDLVIDNKFYNVLIEESSKYLKNHNNIELYDKEQFEEEVNNIDNYKILVFSENCLYVVFTPHIVSPYEGDINVPINYELINEYLNNEYFTSIEKDDIKNDDIDHSKEIKRIRDYKEFEGKKIVALTFDDGPAHSKTETLLTEFEKRNIRASFFVLGELALKQPDIVKKAYNMGHTIGSHTYDHKNLKKIDDEQLAYEVNYTNEILKEIIGTDIKFIRPPYGGYNTDILNSVDMSFILWSVDTWDWQLKDADKIADYMVNNIEDGDIVLLHDIHAETIDGVIKAVDLMQADGYAFVSLEELIAYKNIVIQTHKAYRFFRSEEIIDKDEITEEQNEEIVNDDLLNDPRAT